MELIDYLRVNLPPENFATALPLFRAKVQAAYTEGQEEILDYLRRHHGPEIYQIERPQIMKEMERYARVVDEIVDPMTTRRENLERVAAAKK
jgi:hypothetical protein